MRRCKSAALACLAVLLRRRVYLLGDLPNERACAQAPAIRRDSGNINTWVSSCVPATLVGMQRTVVDRHAHGTDWESPAVAVEHTRAVLSFVRRSGRLDARLQRAWEAYSEHFLLDINSREGSFDVRPGFSLEESYVAQTWGNANPLIVEVGTGQGENVVAAAAANPGTNYLAIEVYDPGVAHTMLLAGKRGLENVKIARVNAPELFFAAGDGVISEVWTFFPDPWPKMKHHKRRIVQPSLADELHRALRPQGVWRLATDIEDYALHVHEVMDQRPDFRNEGDSIVSLPLGHVGKGNADRAEEMPHADFRESTRFSGRVPTNFERKGVAAGRVIHDFTYRRR